MTRPNNQQVNELSAGREAGVAMPTRVERVPSQNLLLLVFLVPPQLYIQHK